ncbi:MAG: ABC transporter substrate binding protein [Dehalococcoidales bacterium]
MKKLCFIISVLLLVAVLGCIKPSEKVLLIFSYHPEHPWVVEETRGAEDILEERGVETEKFYLDTKRNTSTEWKEEVAEEAVRKIDDFKPDLVIVFDDNACELVAKEYIGESLPFVFCGMNGEPEDYGFPAQNITGVIERHHLEATIELLRRLVPDVEKLAIMSDDSPTSQAFITRVQNIIPPIEISESYTTNDFDAWKAEVNRLQTNVDAIGIYVYHTIKENSEEQSLPPEDVLGWTLKNSELPGFAFSDFTVRDGVLCGVTVSGYEQGMTAAEIAIRILNGETPADIPIKCPEEGTPMINEIRAEELNIEIPADVLEEVEILP